MPELFVFGEEYEETFAGVRFTELNSAQATHPVVLNGGLASFPSGVLSNR